MNILNVRKISDISNMNFHDILTSTAICFILGMLLNRFTYNKKNNCNDNKYPDYKTNNISEEQLLDKNIKMVFVCKVQGKHQSTLLSLKTAECSVESYKNILLLGSDYNKKVLDIWDTYGSKKVVLKVSDVSEIDIIYNQLKTDNVICYKSTDFPLLVIGPDTSDVIDKYTGHLKLMS